MTVFSRIHILAENVNADTGEGTDKDPRMQNLLTSPTHVLQPDAFEMMKRTDCGAAIQALHDCDIFRLPYPKMIMEWCLREGNASHFAPEFANDAWEPLHEFVHLEEKQDASGKYGIVAEYAFVFTKCRIGGLFADKLAFLPTDTGLTMGFEKNIDPRMLDVAKNAAVIAINASLVLMNMKGIEREVHTFTPLNKQREKKGKPRIPQYTYLRIGHVYKADGTRVKYTEGDHRHMPMHVRSAHTRRQHFGKENAETKIIFVPSCIVNFDPGSNLPQKPRPKVIKA
jgi:hypothetical protein